MEELLTGKNKEQFEKWYLANIREELKHREMRRLIISPFMMQIGVLLAYYDSLGLSIVTKNSFLEDKYRWFIEHHNDGKHPFDIDLFKSRNEAYKQAFIKANEIVNNT